MSDTCSLKSQFLFIPSIIAGFIHAISYIYETVLLQIHQMNIVFNLNAFTAPFTLVLFLGQDAYVHCKETSDEQLERLMEEFVYPCDDSGAMKVCTHNKLTQLIQI